MASALPCLGHAETTCNRLDGLPLSLDERELKLAPCRLGRIENDPSILNRLVDDPVDSLASSHFGDFITRQAVEGCHERPICSDVAIGHPKPIWRQFAGVEVKSEAFLTQGFVVPH
ncbi:hypothetical protein ABMA32_05320 [Mesorhizobium sp. VNQ89]|uniref:hypothetical protein n=1 Tax=Mesorhizobium quangtriensis TaxID=3157709 RepID=UPI0032B73ECE